MRRGQTVIGTACRLPACQSDFVIRKVEWDAEVPLAALGDCQGGFCITQNVQGKGSGEPRQKRPFLTHLV